MVPIMDRCRRLRHVGLFLLLFSLSRTVSSDPIDLAAVRQAIEQSTIAGVAISASGFQLTAGPATIHLLDGYLYPTEAIGGRPVELVFQGSGRVDLSLDDPVEQGQLELFTGAPTMSEPFTEAVLVMALDQAVDAALSLGDSRPIRPDESRIIEGVLELWRTSSERKLLDVEARILADALGDPLAAGYFSGMFYGSRLGAFLYSVDPLADEQVTIGQLVKPELDRRQRRQARWQLSHAQRQGKLIGVELEDLGRWTTWVSCPLRLADGKPAAGTLGLEALHYSHDVTVSRREPELTATTRIVSKSLVAGLRTATLSMHPDLTPLQVGDGTGNALPFFRSHGELIVVLPKSPAPGDTLTIEVSYEARPFERDGPARFWPRRTLAWHPRLTENDRATFDATVRWPRELILVGNGRVVESGESEDGLRWQRREMQETPCTGFSFELGRFELLRRKVGHVEVSVAIDQAGQKVSEELAEDIFATIQDGLGFYEETFGPYPLDALEVVTSPRVYSQGLLGFITLSASSMGELGEWGALLGVQDRRMVIAHELAHQWWGNLVGWRSYRDQWISEAMANYSALLYARHRLQRLGEPKVWLGPTSGWASWLLKTTGHGVPVESLGPVVLGTRLKSAHSHTAYEAIVYKKGAIILDTLARLFTEKEFLKILRQVVVSASFRSISTDQLLEQVERLSGLDLGWFARQYVYGTGMPEVFYSYQVSPRQEGGWQVSGSCRQHSPYHYRYRIAERSPGQLDVVRHPVLHLDVTESIMVVPFLIGLKASRHGESGSGQQMLTGNLVIRGAETPIEALTEQEPEIILLDRRQEVFGRFFCQTCWPRQTMLTQALSLEAEGRQTEAEAMMRTALTAPMVGVPDSWQDADQDLARQTRLLNIRIHLALARLYLDANRFDEASARLTEARALLTRSDRWQFEKDLVAADARLKLRRGEAQAAFDQLVKSLRDRRYSRTGETYALLAIAAYEIGDQQSLHEARKRAEEHGVDTGIFN
jgi:hypothetical protein